MGLLSYIECNVHVNDRYNCLAPEPVCARCCWAPHPPTAPQGKGTTGMAQYPGIVALSSLWRDCVGAGRLRPSHACSGFGDHAVLVVAIVWYTRAHRNNQDRLHNGWHAGHTGGYVTSSRRLLKGSRMETVTDISIHDHFVIHVLDNRLPAVQCSQTLTPLPDTLRDSLHRYLLALLKPQFRRKRYGRFQSDSVVLHAYQQMLASLRRHGQVEAPAFLTASQHLAARLFEAMRQSPQNGHGAQPRPGAITPGDLLVGLFQGIEPEPVPEPWLFLIKVDLETALQRQLRPYGADGVQTVLSPCDGIIPKLSTDKVHKFALIRFADDPATYDVLMADPQGGKPDIARFFAEDFLQTAPFRTTDEQAELLFTRTYDWVNTHEEVLSPQERGAVLQSVRTLLTDRAARDEPVAPRDLVASLPLTEPRPQEVVAELRQSFAATITALEDGVDSIPINRELRIHTVPRVAKRTQVTYQLDFGVQLSGEPEAIERLFVQPPHRVAEHTEFTIRTLTFRPVV